jgi:hypothetical protein
MADHFSIGRETQAGIVAARAWLEANPDHTAVTTLAENASLPFEECAPTVIATTLQVSRAGFKRWWQTYGSEQEASHSFTFGFLREIARLRPAAALPAPPEEPASPPAGGGTDRPAPFTVRLAGS